jgi:hypothetical protein
MQLGCLNQADPLFRRRILCRYVCKPGRRA